MFNTGTIIGVNANVFGGGFPAKFIPSFVWGGADGFQTYDLKKAIEVGKIVMERRSVELNADDEAILTQVFEDSKRHRESLA